MNNTMNFVAFQCFTLEQVKEINKQIKKNPLKKEPSSYISETSSKRGDFYHLQCTPEVMELIHPWLYQCQMINKNKFGYDILWDFHLDILSYNVYGTGGEYDWHVDGSNPDNSSTDTKLTCLLNLSEEPCDGGELCLINQKEPLKFESGMGLVFTSLIAHKVNPVIKGERVTLTYWATGLSWR